MISHQFVLKMLFGLGFFEKLTTDLGVLYFLRRISDIRDALIDPLLLLPVVPSGIMK